MKKIAFVLMVVCFIAALPIFLIHVHAQESPDVSVASPSPAIDYKLPYPGMLPDSSLYKLKVLRDKIMLALIRDPDKKAQYYLLLANKQLLMSKMLVERGNIPLARETALKGEDQMTQMTFVFKNANRVPQADFMKEVTLATAKHQELLKEMIAEVPAEDAATFSQVLEFSQRNVDELQNLTNETK
jgi:hypothetical protein